MNRLRLWRLQTGLKQTEAAKRLGIGLSTYCLLEAGRLRPSRAQWKRLSAFFGPNVADILSPVREKVEEISR